MRQSVNVGSISSIFQAMLLARAGAKVLLLDRQPYGDRVGTWSATSPPEEPGPERTTRRGPSWGVVGAVVDGKR